MKSPFQSQYSGSPCKSLLKWHFLRGALLPLSWKGSFPPISRPPLPAFSFIRNVLWNPYSVHALAISYPLKRALPTHSTATTACLLPCFQAPGGAPRKSLWNRPMTSAFRGTCRFSRSFCGHCLLLGAAFTASLEAGLWKSSLNKT